MSFLALFRTQRLFVVTFAVAIAVCCALVTQVVLAGGTQRGSSQQGPAHTTAVKKKAKKKKKKDRTSPYVISSTTRDTDDDGLIDRLEVVYSEKVFYRKVKAPPKTKKTKKAKKTSTSSGAAESSLTLKQKQAKCKKIKNVKLRKKCLKKLKKKPIVPAIGVVQRTVKAVTIRPNRLTLIVDIEEAAKADTGATPSFRYLRSNPGYKGIVDKAANQALSGTVKTKDGAAPQLTGAATRDLDVNGRLDSVQAEFTEPIKTVDSALITIASRLVTAGTASPEGNVIVSIVELGPDTGTSPFVEVVPGAVKDLADNALVKGNGVTPRDAAPPSAVDALTQDLDSDGRLDHAVISFSEPIFHLADSGADSVLGMIGYVSESTSAAVGASVTLAFREGTQFDTGALPAAEVRASGSPIADFSFNIAKASAPEVTRDGAPPRLVSSRTKDADGNGNVDGVRAVFSERVGTAGTASAFTISAPINAVTSVVASGASLTVNTAEESISTEPDYFNTGLPAVGSPISVNYSGPSAGATLDIAGNPALPGSVNVTDGAGPAPIGATTFDVGPQVDAGATATSGAHNGRIDRVEVGFSEPVAQITGNPFDVAGGARTVVGSALSSAGDSLALAIKEVALGYDGEEKPNIAYAPSTTEIISDALGNLGTISKVPFTETVDGAEPILTSVSTFDGNGTNANGKIDRLRAIWSEPVGPAGPAAGSAGLGTAPAPVKVLSGAIGISPAAIDVAAAENGAAIPDRDLEMLVGVVAPTASTGVKDAAGNPAWPGAVTDFTVPPLCFDDTERQDNNYLHDDSRGATGVATLANNLPQFHTLCGGDDDWFKLAAVTPTGPTGSVAVLFAPEAGSPRGVPPAAGATPPTIEVTNNSGTTVSSSVTAVAGEGWMVEFTPPVVGNDYFVHLVDATLPVVDYGYCVSFRQDSVEPTCALRPGDVVFTEVIQDPTTGSMVPAWQGGPYIEMRNTSGATIQTTAVGGNDTGDLSDTSIRYNGGVQCDIVRRTDSLNSIPPGGLFYVTALDDTAPARTGAFGCADSNSFVSPVIDYNSPLELRVTTAGRGLVDRVNFAPVNIPDYRSVQLRPGPEFQTFTGNDNNSLAWCVSLPQNGSPGTENADCDQFRIEEVDFLPLGAGRDGNLFVELRGNTPLRDDAALLNSWRIRVVAGGQAKIFQLSATASPNDAGLFVLADGPDAGGITYVPRYSEQVADLDDFLRDDGPVTVQLLKRDLISPTTCDPPTDGPVDVFGYRPTTTLFSGASDPCGLLYESNPFVLDSNFTDASAQRTDLKADSNNNADTADFCLISPVSPLDPTLSCVEIT